MGIEVPIAAFLEGTDVDGLAELAGSRIFAAGPPAGDVQAVPQGAASGSGEETEWVEGEI